MSAPWVAEHLGPAVREAGAAAATDRALGGKGGHEAICCALRLAGKLAREVRRAIPQAAEMEEYRTTAAWSDAIWEAGDLVLPGLPEDPSAEAAGKEG